MSLDEIEDEWTRAEPPERRIGRPPVWDQRLEQFKVLPPNEWRRYRFTVVASTARDLRHRQTWGNLDPRFEFRVAREGLEGDRRWLYVRYLS